MWDQTGESRVYALRRKAAAEQQRFDKTQVISFLPPEDQESWRAPIVMNRSRRRELKALSLHSLGPIAMSLRDVVFGQFQLVRLPILDQFAFCIRIQKLVPDNNRPPLRQ